MTAKKPTSKSTGAKSKVTKPKAVKPAEARATAQQSEFDRNWDTNIRELHQKIDELSEKAKTATGDAKVRADALLEQLNAQLEAAEREYEKAKSGGEAEWEALKVKADRAFGDIASGVKEALSRFA